MSYENISAQVQEAVNLEDGLIVDNTTYYTCAKEAGLDKETIDKVHGFHVDFIAGSGDALGRMAVAEDLPEATATFDFGNGCVEHHFQRQVEIAGEQEYNYLTTMSTYDLGTDSAVAKVQKALAALYVADAEAALEA